VARPRPRRGRWRREEARLVRLAAPVPRAPAVAPAWQRVRRPDCVGRRRPAGLAAPARLARGRARDVDYAAVRLRAASRRR
jgi:hypothetical protein